MRSNDKIKLIRVKEEVYNRIVSDKQRFQKTIGGGSWSINDTLMEYIKILNQLK